MQENTRGGGDGSPAVPASCSSRSCRPKAVQALFLECQVGRLDKLMDDLKEHPETVNARDSEGPAKHERLTVPLSTGISTLLLHEDI